MAKILFSPRQSMAWQVLEDKLIDTLLYGGAKGGGKSVFGCYWVFLKCLDIITRFQLTPRKYPIPVGFMGRKQSVDFNDTTLETWKSFIPEDAYDLRSGDKEIVIRGAVKVQYGGFDSQDTIKKFNSAEYVFGFIDQAEETSRDDYGLLRGTYRRQINGVPLPYKTLLTANPANCWLKDEFITTLASRCAFVRALPADNPFLPDSYVDNLREAFKHRPELLEAYIEGSWDILAGANLVIKPSWVESSIGRRLPFDTDKRVVACDPARFGDDETVIYVLEGTKIIHAMIYGQRSTMETAGHLIALKNKFKCQLIGVEEVGIGAGIVDRLRELREPVLAINPGSKATTELKEAKFCNRRAEIIWEGGEQFANEETSIPKDDRVIRNQLTNICYEIDSRGRIKIEPKEDIKERMSGQSPDRAEAYLLGLHTLKFVPERKGDFQRTKRSPHKRDGYGWRTSQHPLVKGYLHG